MVQGPITPPQRVPQARIPWWGLFIAGLLCVVFAAGLVAFPWVPIEVLAIIIGIAFIGSGVSAGLLQRGLLGAVSGLTFIVVGVLAIVFADVLGSVLVALFGFALIAFGSIWLILTLALRASLPFTLPAVLMIVAGIVTLVWPTVTLTVVAVIIGGVLIIAGVWLMRQALAVRKRTVPKRV